MSDDLCSGCGGPKHPLQLSEGRGFWYANCRGKMVMMRTSTRGEQDAARREDAARALEIISHHDYAI